MSKTQEAVRYFAAAASAMSTEQKRQELQLVFGVAGREQEWRNSKLKNAGEEAKKILRIISNLNKDINRISNQEQSLIAACKMDMQEIISLLKYIETRPLKPGCELSFLYAYAEGRDADLNQYLS